MRISLIFIITTTLLLFTGCIQNELEVINTDYNISIIPSDNTITLYHQYKCNFKNLKYGELPPTNEKKYDKFKEKNFLINGADKVLHKKWIYTYLDSVKLKNQLDTIYQFHQDAVRYEVTNEVPSPFFNIIINPDSKIRKKDYLVVKWCNKVTNDIAINEVPVDIADRKIKKATVNFKISKTDDDYYFNASKINMSGILSDTTALKNMKVAVINNFNKYARLIAIEWRHSPSYWDKRESRHVRINVEEEIWNSESIGEILKLHKYFSELNPKIIIDYKD